LKKRTEKTFTDDASELNHQLYAEGIFHYNAGPFSKAKRAFEEALEHWPEDPQAWLAHGNCLDDLSKPTQAKKSFRNALKYCKAEDVAAYTYNLGNSLFDQGKYGEAVDCYASIPPAGGYLCSSAAESDANQ